MNLSIADLSDRVRKLQELNENFGFRISHLTRLIQLEAHSRLKTTGLNLNEYRIITILGIFGEATARDLSDLMLVDKARISRDVAGLVRNGYLQSRKHPTNKLFKLLSLTDEGAEQNDQFKALFSDRNSIIETDVTAEEREAFHRVLSILIETMENRLGDQAQSDAATGAASGDY